MPLTSGDDVPDFKRYVANSPSDQVPPWETSHFSDVRPNQGRTLQFDFFLSFGGNRSIITALVISCPDSEGFRQDPINMTSLAPESKHIS